MRYVISHYSLSAKEESYRIYITDTLYLQGQNKRLSVRYADIINKRKKEDTRSGDEIALEVIEKLGLKVKQNECI